LLLVAGAPPSLRIYGLVTRLLEAPLGGEEIADAVLPALPPHARKAYHDVGIADASFRTPDLGRFRINLHHERGRTAAAIRRLPSAVPRLATLGCRWCRSPEPPGARPRAGRRSYWFRKTTTLAVW
jgi:Tfp pilus assembly pilus retraction ATPase PilT